MIGQFAAQRPPYKGGPFILEDAMPVKLERELKQQAKHKGLKGEHKDAYVYGTLRKTGWKPTREKASKPTPGRRGSP